MNTMSNYFVIEKTALNVAGLITVCLFIFILGYIIGNTKVVTK